MAESGFLSEEEKKQITTAIQQAEESTMGEIRVYLEKKCSGDVMERALKIFHQLKMELTKERMGVLIYIAYSDRVFAVLGDQGINEKVPATFWDDVKELMAKHFSENKFLNGITEAVLQCGLHLKEHFPKQQNDINELSDEVVTGDE